MKLINNKSLVAPATKPSAGKGRWSLVCVIVAAALVAAGASVGIAQQPHFSKPILIGGEKAAPTSRQTQAVDLEFIKHPYSLVSKQNFKLDAMGLKPKLNLSGYNPVEINSVVGTPGFVPTTPVPVDSTSNMLDPLPATTPGALSPLHGFAPDYFEIMNSQSSFQLGIGSNHKVGDGNRFDHHLEVADVRDENTTITNETETLFGLPQPDLFLEDALLGNAAPISPYSDSLYPSAIIAARVTHNFRWCAGVNSGLWGIYIDCSNKLFGSFGDSYNEVFLYSLADIRDGVVSASYDPFSIVVLPEKRIYGHAGSASFQFNLTYTQSKAFPLISPLVFFREDTNIKPPRMVLTGATSYEWPHLRIPLADPKDQNKTVWNTDELYKMFWTNPFVPPNTNPIAVLTVPDSDLAVVYQTTLFGLNSWVTGIYGRPRVFPEGPAGKTGQFGWHYRYRDLIGTCATENIIAAKFPAEVDCGTFTPINNISGTNIGNPLPEDTISPVVFSKQVRKWGKGTYEDMNPSTVFDPYLASPVGPGAYHAAVMNDQVAATAQQYLLVPSGEFTGTTTSPVGVVYRIDPINDPTNGKRLYWKGWTLKPTGSSLTGFTYSWSPVYYRTPAILPTPIFIDHTGHSNFVPYHIVAANLDGDKCEDFIVTWRGASTVSDDPKDLSSVKFSSDGTITGKMFADHASIIYRTDSSGVCTMKTNPVNIEIVAPTKTIVTVDAVTPVNIAPYGLQTTPQTTPQATPEISSVAVGDVDGNGVLDIVLANALPEDDGTGKTSSAVKFSSFVHIIHGQKLASGKIKFENLLNAYSSLSSFAGGHERVRVGAKSDTDKSKIWGVSMVKVDTKNAQYNPNPIAAISGKPLALREIGCPTYGATPNNEVGSVYETFSGSLMNIVSGALFGNFNMANPQAPFLASFSAGPFHPLPPHCVNKTPCKVQVGGDDIYGLPLWNDDPCCACPAYDYPLATATTTCGHLFVQTCDTTGANYADISYSNVWNTSVYSRRYCEDVLNSVLKNKLLNWCTPSNQKIVSSLNNPSIPLFADDDQGGESGSDTDFAIGNRADEIYESNARAIVDMRDLVTAQYADPSESTNETRNSTRSDNSHLDAILEKILPPDMPAGDRATIEENLGPAFRELEISLSQASDHPLSQFATQVFAAAASEEEEGQPTAENRLSGNSLPAAGCALAANVSLFKDVRLPRGHIPAGHREMTAVVWLKPLKCNYNGKVDLSSEQCDIANIAKLEDAIAKAKQQCPKSSQGMEASDCRMNDCTCAYAQPGCVELKKQGKTVQCVSDMDCDAGQMCKFSGDSSNDCTCFGGSSTTQVGGGAQADGGAQTQIQDTECYATSFSSNLAMESYEAANKEFFRGITGRRDDLFVEPWQSIECTTWTKETSAPGSASLSTSLSGSAIPGVSGNIRPYAVIQTGGAVLKTQGFEEVVSPLRIYPVSELVGLNLSSSPDPNVTQLATSQSLSSAVENMPEPQTLSDGSISINNGAIIHRAVALAPGETFSASGNISLQAAASSNDLPGTGSVVIIDRYTVPRCGGWTGVEHYVECPYQGGIDLAKLKEALLKSTVTEKAPLRDATYNLVPTDYRYYQFHVLQSAYAKAGESEPAPVDMKYGFIAGNPMELGVGGGGCGCHIVGADIGSVLAPLIAAFLAAGGIVAGRRRMRK